MTFDPRVSDPRISSPRVADPPGFGPRVFAPCVIGPRVFGWRVYGLGVMALGMVCLTWGNFDSGQPVPKDFPARTALAYTAAAFMLLAGAAVEWRRTVAWGAAALTTYYILVVVILLNGRVLLSHYTEFGVYSGTAEQLAIASGGLIVYAAGADIDAVLAARLTRLGQLAFGVCALLYEPHRATGSQVAAADARVLGVRDRDWTHRGRHCHPDERASAARRHTADRHVRILHPAGACAHTPCRSLELFQLDRERLECRPHGRRLGGGRFAGPA
jgi:hypothetical protein